MHASLPCPSAAARDGLASRMTPESDSSCMMPPQVEFAMELMRVASVWLAFRLLRQSRGGRGHFLSLERSRLGLAPDSRESELLAEAVYGDAGGAGQTDGSSSAGGVAANGGGVLRRFQKGGRGSGGGVASGVYAPEQLKRGGVLRHLLVYDVGAFTFVYAAGLAHLAYVVYTTDCARFDCAAFDWHEALHHRHTIGGDDSPPPPRPPLLNDWRFWMTLDFCSTAYALLLLPYVIFNLSSLKRYLTRAKATGYDRMGRLCVELTAAEKVRKAARCAEEAEAAATIQALVRGRAIRRSSQAS